MVERNVDDRPIPSEQVRRLGAKVKDFVFLTVLEAVQTPRGFRFACFRGHVVLERHAVDSVGLGSEQARRGEIGRIRIWFWLRLGHLSGRGGRSM